MSNLDNLKKVVRAVVKYRHAVHGEQTQAGMWHIIEADTQRFYLGSCGVVYPKQLGFNALETADLADVGETGLCEMCRLALEVDNKT